MKFISFEISVSMQVALWHSVNADVFARLVTQIKDDVWATLEDTFNDICFKFDDYMIENK